MTPDHVAVLSPPADVRMANDYFEFTSADHPWFRWRLDAVRRVLRGIDLGLSAGEHNGAEVLDVGCGDAVGTAQLEACLNTAVDGCDLNMAALRRAGSIRGTVYCYDILDRHAEMAGRYSLVCLLDTLEHIPDAVGFLRAVRHHTRSGGHLLINVPAMPSLYGVYDEVNGHVCRYTIRRLRDECRRAGFEPVCESYWGLTALPVAWVRKLVLARTPRDRVIERGFAAQSRFARATLNTLRQIEVYGRLPTPAGFSLCALYRNPG